MLQRHRILRIVAQFTAHGIRNMQFTDSKLEIFSIRVALRNLPPPHPHLPELGGGSRKNRQYRRVARANGGGEKRREGKEKAKERDEVGEEGEAQNRTVNV